MLRLRDAPVRLRQHSRVAGEQVLEPKIGQEMARLRKHPSVVFGAVAKQIQTLGVLLPACRLPIANPKVPSRRHFVADITRRMLSCQFDDFRGSRQVAAQIVFFEGRFGEVHSSNRQPCESRWGRSQRQGGEESLEVREHVLFAEIANPNACVGTVWHPDIIQSSANRTEKLRELAKATDRLPVKAPWATHPDLDLAGLGMRLRKALLEPLLYFLLNEGGLQTHEIRT